MSKVYPQLKLENQLCFPFYACARKIVNLYTPHLKPLGLTYTQYLVMMVMWEDNHTTIKRICERLHLDSGTITPLIQKLVKRGLLEKCNNPEDERITCVNITESGIQLQEKAKSIPMKVGSCISLSQEEAEMLYKTMYKILGK